jgi:transcriptional regulator with XRE-family HTH domain
MATKPYKRLHVNSVEESNDLRVAIARVLVDVQHDYGLTLHEIAEALDVSLGTISNAANKKCDLSSVYRDRIGKVFGVEYLNPIARLIGGRMVPDEGSDLDVLPPLSASIHRIAVARSPDSEGGEVVTHRELLAMVPDLRAASLAINALIAKAERIAA